MTSRGTTPTYTLILPDTVELPDSSKVFVTFSNKDYRKILEKTGSDLTITDGYKIELFLSQDDTLKFPLEHVLVQVNWIKQGVRMASKVKKIATCRNLKEVVVQ